MKAVWAYWFLKVREVPQMSVGTPVPGTEQLSSKYLWGEGAIWKWLERQTARWYRPGRVQSGRGRAREEGRDLGALVSCSRILRGFTAGEETQVWGSDCAKAYFQRRRRDVGIGTPYG